MRNSDVNGQHKKVFPSQTPSFIDVDGGVKIPKANINGSSDAVTEVIHEAIVDDVSEPVTAQSKKLLITES